MHAKPDNSEAIFRATDLSLSLPRRLKWVGLFSVLSSLPFLALALVRQLNFDEWLVLRAGWLLVNEIPSDLHFLMPFTWLAGQLGSLSPDVATPIFTLRFGAGILVLWTLWRALNQHAKTPAQACAAFFLCLINGAFVSHAFEFRYDAVILTCWLWSWGLVGRPRDDRTFFVLGLMLSLLALHHTKGLFYAFSLGAYVMATMHVTRRSFVRLLAGALLVLAPWTLLLTAAGLTQEQLAIYLQFSSLAMDGPHLDPWSALQGRLEADFSWWLLVLPPVILSIWRGWKQGHIQTSIWFLLTPIAFIALHPRPWDYLVTPLVPFFALLAADGAWTLLNHVRHRLRNFIILGLCPTLLFYGCANIYAPAFHAVNFDDVRTLRLLSAHMGAGDTVLDPVGAAFFVPPLEPQWYLDTLFQKPLAEGHWMRVTAEKADQATIIISSYRLDWLPERVHARLLRSHVQVCGWIWLRRGDGRAPALQENCPEGVAATLHNFWGS